MQIKNVYLASAPKFACVIVISHSILILGLLIIKPLPLLICGVITLILHARHIIIVHALRTHKYSVHILYNDNDYWQYGLKSLQQCRGVLISERSFCSAFFLILYIRHFNRYKYIVVTRDALSEHCYRYLAYYVKC